MPGTSDFNKSVVVFGLLISLLLVLFIGGLRKDHGWQSFNSLRLPHGAPAVQLKIATNIFTSGRNGQSGHDLPAAWAEALRARAEGPNCKLFENGQSIVRMTNITDGPHMFGYFDKVRSCFLGAGRIPEPSACVVRVAGQPAARTRLLEVNDHRPCRCNTLHVFHTMAPSSSNTHQYRCQPCNLARLLFAACRTPCTTWRCAILQTFLYPSGAHTY